MNNEWKINEQNLQKIFWNNKVIEFEVLYELHVTNAYFIKPNILIYRIYCNVVVDIIPCTDTGFFFF